MLTENLFRLLGRPVEILPPPLTTVYPRRQVRSEVIKGALGFGVCFAIVVFLQPVAFVGWPLTLVGILFLLYLGQQISRLFMRVELDRDGIKEKSRGREKKLLWKDLETLRLNYYPRSKGKATGMLVLVLRGKGRRLKLDSTLEHFPSLLSQAADAARAAGIELNPTTQSNLGELGL